MCAVSAAVLRQVQNTHTNGCQAAFNYPTTGDLTPSRGHNAEHDIVPFEESEPASTHTNRESIWAVPEASQYIYSREVSLLLAKHRMACRTSDFRGTRRQKQCAGPIILRRRRRRAEIFDSSRRRRRRGEIFVYFAAPKAPQRGKIE